ncbi:MAG: hypothetical protein ABI175_29570, partial [Polyangiales bacterium]
GGRGAAVVTENGVEFRDVADVPQRIISRDVDDPWKSPIGFILPKDGKFTKTSSPLMLASQGIVVVVRASDTRVPSWGGEILLRLDVHATPFSNERPAEQVAIVVDGISDKTAALVETALSQLGARDRVVVIDAHGPRIVVPKMPATHRSLAFAATVARLSTDQLAPHDLPAALRLAGKALGEVGTRRVVVLRDGLGGPSAAVSSELVALGVAGVAWHTFTIDDDGAAAAIRAFVPAAGLVTFEDFRLSLDGTPAPSRMLESSGGEAIWTIDGSELHLGDLHAGEARAEIIRVTVPAWVPGTTFTLHLTATARDAASAMTRTFPATMAFTYDDDIERIAESRHGDVIAYASALATLHRLHEAFVGFGKDPTAIRRLALLQSKSLTALAKDFPDRGFAEDAAVLEALLAATPP